MTDSLFIYFHGSRTNFPTGFSFNLFSRAEQYHVFVGMGESNQPPHLGAVRLFCFDKYFTIIELCAQSMC